MNQRNIPEFIFLCDGKKECHESPFCYINGGECKHTTSLRHSKNGYSDIKRPNYKDFEAEEYDNTLTKYFEKED